MAIKSNFRPNFIAHPIDLCSKCRNRACSSAIRANLYLLAITYILLPCKMSMKMASDFSREYHVPFSLFGAKTLMCSSHCFAIDDLIEFGAVENY